MVAGNVRTGTSGALYGALSSSGTLLLAPPEGPRGPVVAFSGRLRYRPNELAVKRLVERIWPRVVREVLVSIGCEV